MVMVTVVIVLTTLPLILVSTVLLVVADKVVLRFFRLIELLPGPRELVFPALTAAFVPAPTPPGEPVVPSIAFNPATNVPTNANEVSSVKRSVLSQLLASVMSRKRDLRINSLEYCKKLISVN